MVIIPNFLDQPNFDRIRNTLLNPNFPWYYHSSIDYDPSKFDSLDSPYNFQFVHSFYSNYTPNSPYMEMLFPLIDKLNPIAIVKIKANLVTRTDKILEHNMHVDITDVKCKTSILYINTNNGYTKFQSGEIVGSEENKLVTFDSDLMHTGTTCTDDKCRLVINLNYF